MEKLKKILTNTPEAFLYALALTVVTMIPYIPNNLIVIVVSFIGMFGMYYLINELDDYKKNKVSIVAYIISFALIGIGSSFEISGTSFYIWILTGYHFDMVFIPYIVFLFLICIAFYGVSTFYFTYFYYRGYIMVFLLMIPVALYYKMVEVVPVIYIIFVVISLFFIYIFQMYKQNILRDQKQIARINKKHIRKKIKEIKKVTFSLSTKIFLIVSALVIALTSIIIPKSEVAEYRHLFDEFVSMNPFSNRNISSISQLTDKSTAANYGYLSKSRILFYGTATEPLYLRRSAFGKYDGDVFIRQDNKVVKNWEEHVAVHSLENVYKQLTFLYDMFPDIFEEFNIDKKDIPNIREEELSVDLDMFRFSTNYFINTVRVTGLEQLTDYDSLGTIQMDRYGGLTDTHKDRINTEYRIYYYRDKAREEESLMTFAKKFDSDEYARFIKKLKDKTYETDYMLEHYDDISFKQAQYWLDSVNAQLNDNPAEYNRNYSDRIKELAIEITKDCDNDIDRAIAIESYFWQNGYEYSSSYEPEDTSIEYFIFESKKGACREYATSMTLMLHALGINSRYVEGFVMEKRYPNGRYYVTAGDSHAYVEVYIPGYGYTVFEPTVGGDDEEAAGIISGAINRFTNVIEIGRNTAIYFILATVIIITLIVIYKIAFYEKTICSYIIRKCKKANSKTVKLYEYIQKYIASYEGEEIYALTPSELTKKLHREYDIEISDITDILIRRIYGEENIEISEDMLKRISDIRKQYKEIWRVKGKSL